VFPKGYQFCTLADIPKETLYYSQLQFTHAI
jgi:hypothetical protein